MKVVMINNNPDIEQRIVSFESDPIEISSIPDEKGIELLSQTGSFENGVLVPKPEQTTIKTIKSMIAKLDITIAGYNLQRNKMIEKLEMINSEPTIDFFDENLPVKSTDSLDTEIVSK